MKKLLFCILILIFTAVTHFSCVGYQASYSGGFGTAYGPYGYGGYPRMNVGVYGGGYPHVRY